MTSSRWAPAASARSWSPSSRVLPAWYSRQRMASSDQIRLLLVEDVPQVAQYIRSLLNAQAHIKLLEVLTDGSKAVSSAQQLRPDVILVDALLQGRVKGLALVEQIQRERIAVPVIVLTVPQNPV